MSALQSYNAFSGESYLTSSQVPEKLLKSYTIASGATSITISDPAFSLTTYKAIHVRINNPIGSITSGSFRALPLKNGQAVSGTYNLTHDNPFPNGTSTGYGSLTSTGTPIALTGVALDLTKAVSQIDLYLNKNGGTYLFDCYLSAASTSLRIRGTMIFPTFPQTFTSSDFIGLVFDVSGGTFTGGTIDVYGEV